MDPQPVPMNRNPDSEEEETITSLDPPPMRAVSNLRPFLCPQCPKTYCLQKQLDFHMRIHSPDNTQSPLCNKVFPNGSQLTEHLENLTEEKLHKCPADGCGQEFVKLCSLGFHMQTRHGKKIHKPTCAICEKSYANTKSLRTHYVNYHSSQKKEHHCVTCGKACVSLQELKRHLETHTVPQNCPICGKRCRNGLALKEHVQRHGWEGTYKCEHCAKNFKTNANLKKHIRTDHCGQKYNRDNMCLLRGLKWSKPFNLARHLKTHTGDIPYKCDKCSMVFGDTTTLKTHRFVIHPTEQREEDRQPPTYTQVDGDNLLHIPSEQMQGLNKNSHTKLDPQVGPTNANPGSQESETPVALPPPGMGPEPRPFPCPQCPKILSLQNTLNVHMNVHSPDNPHLCPICNNVFPNDNQLTLHMRSHTGEKLFKCPVDGCGKEFMRRQALEIHKRIHTEEKPEPKPDHLRLHTGERPFKCTTCSKAFTSKGKLRFHWKVHTGQKSKECQLCGRKCSSASALAIHLRTHTGERPFKCTTCSKAFTTKYKLRDHCKVHTGEKPEECQFCGQRFALKAALVRHIRTHTGETPYKCDNCIMVFGDSTTLKMHRLAIHPKEQREEVRQIPTLMQVDGLGPLHIPSENQQGLNNSSSAKLNIQVGLMNASPESEEKETPVVRNPPQTRAAPQPSPLLKTSLNSHMKVHSPDNPHVCPLCNKVFQSDSLLTAHLRSHIGERIFKCYAVGCGKEFALQHTLWIHMRTHYGGEMGTKPTCAICEKSFATPEGLRIHNKKFHKTEIKQHPCVTCGKVYILLGDLKRHLQTHLPDDPQTCPTCGKSCRNGHVLKEHVHRHGWDGTFKCEHCAKNFKTKSILKTHIRIFHNAEGRKVTKIKNHVCNFCGAKFGSRGQLSNHLRLHTGERPFKCITCPQAFTTKWNLRRHWKVHTGETPYKCDECGMTFTWSSSLERHMTAAHSGEQQKKASTHVNTDGIVPLDPMTDTPISNTENNDPLAEVVESCSELYLDKGFRLRQLTVPVPRIRLKDVGGGVLELRSEGDSWYMCSKCGRGSKSILIQCHALGCEVRESSNPINETLQTIG